MVMVVMLVSLRSRTVVSDVVSDAVKKRVSLVVTTDSIRVIETSSPASSLFSSSFLLHNFSNSHV